MFTGIIETLGKVVGLEKEGDNLHIDVESAVAAELRVDQSVAHNGVCLTVIFRTDDHYRVTAILETLRKSNLAELEPGSLVNLERCLKIGDRLDGHMVQGHVDTTATVLEIKEENGSWLFWFNFPERYSKLLVPKGSVTVNGVSLTVVEAIGDRFCVAIIPYTYENTNFHTFQPGTRVNLEFDVIGKYVERMISPRLINLSDQG